MISLEPNAISLLILLSCPSIQCWQDYSWMPLSSIVTVFLMASMPSKWVSLIISLSHTKQDKVNKKVVPSRQSFSWPGTAGCSTQSVPLLFRHVQIFGNNLPNTVLIKRLAIIGTVIRRSSHIIWFTRSTLTSILLVECLLLRYSSFTSSWPTLDLLCHTKTHVGDLMLSPYTFRSISSVFLVRSSYSWLNEQEKEEV